MIINDSSKEGELSYIIDNSQGGGPKSSMVSRSYPVGFGTFIESSTKNKVKAQQMSQSMTNLSRLHKQSRGRNNADQMDGLSSNHTGITGLKTMENLVNIREHGSRKPQSLF